MSQLYIGSPAPDFELSDIDGRSYRLSIAVVEGPIVLAFFKISCPVCQLTFPHLQKIRGARILGISQDEPEDTREFANRFGIRFPMLIDEHPYDVSSAYGLEYVPGIFLVEPTGKIALSDSGFRKSTLNEIAGVEMFTPNDGLPASRPG